MNRSTSIFHHKLRELVKMCVAGFMQNPIFYAIGPRFNGPNNSGRNSIDSTSWAGAVHLLRNAFFLLLLPPPPPCHTASHFLPPSKLRNAW
jgi:hypothetical protein